jgi:DNA-binding PucR family transcriptional regulator
VMTFAESGPLSLRCSDLAATRSWVADTLGSLAVDDDGAARLRETLRLFLGSGSSYTATAELLSMHKNSVQYRVQKAEQLRGRPLREDRLDVELALRVCDLLGRAVLLPSR